MERSGAVPAEQKSFYTEENRTENSPTFGLFQPTCNFTAWLCCADFVYMVITGSLVTYVVVWEDFMHEEACVTCPAPVTSCQLPSPELELCFQHHDLSTL